MLLLGFVLLSQNLHRPNIGWLRDALEDYMPLLGNSLTAQPPSEREAKENLQEIENAQELLSFVKHAASVCRDGSIWADERWSVELVRTVGRQAIGRDSFEIKNEVPETSREEAAGARELNRCYISLHFGEQKW